MNPIVNDMMQFIEQFANDGRGDTFTVRAAWRGFTHQNVGRPVKMKVGEMQT